MIFLFGIVYAFVYTPLQALYCVEVLSQPMRGKGMARAYRSLLSRPLLDRNPT